jgi:CheY-specific phosphatase CheX
MEIREINQLLSDAAIEVLESMFFTSVLEATDSVEHSVEGWVSAQLSFRGTPPGRFGIRTSPEASRKLAASFLGQEEDSITETQFGDVICEMANMLCGSVLSRLEKDSLFELSQPKVGPAEMPACVSAVCGFSLEEGPMEVWLAIEEGK